MIICGRFEGIDQRVIDGRGLEEISIGDYVLAGGEVAAMVLLEAVVRLIPGVLGKAESHADESFENGQPEYPQYTRPQQFEGVDIPAVLTSGDHGKIAKWRAEQSWRLPYNVALICWARTSHKTVRNPRLWGGFAL